MNWVIAEIKRSEHIGEWQSRCWAVSLEEAPTRLDALRLIHFANPGHDKLRVVEEPTARQLWRA